jgi:hypothetical protein
VLITNIFTVDNYGHTGLVYDVRHNCDGKVIGFWIVHSRGSGGPMKQFIDLTISNRNENTYSWDFFINGDAEFWAWDTPELIPDYTYTESRFMQGLNSYQRTDEEIISDFWTRIAKLTEDSINEQIKEGIKF